jgi:2-polyprenyl-6-methoxyphenol hydroxylase-like FAD-dependent oxidoreductase
MPPSASASSAPILVAGAGIGGLALARALELAGLEGRLFERAPELAEVGAGITVQTNAMLALRHLGLDEAIRDAGQVVETLSIWTAGGRELGSASLRPAHESLGAVSVIVHRARLQSLLFGSLVATELTLGREVAAVDDTTADGPVLRFADGTTTTGSLVVGCDGSRSAVRASLFPGDTPLRYAGYTTWRGVAEGPPARPPGTATEIWGRRRRFGLVPLGTERLYWYAADSVRAGGEDPAAGRRVDLERRFAGFPPAVHEALAATPESAILRTDVFDRPAPRRWYRGRVVLVGDAVHPMEPNLGQGGCQAIEDAVVLAHCLQTQSDPARALFDYQRRRRRRVARTVRTSRSLGLLTHRLPGCLCPLRDALFGLLPASSMVASLRRRGAFRL